jgi:hypothetical protein
VYFVVILVYVFVNSLSFFISEWYWGGFFKVVLGVMRVETYRIGICF